MEDDKFKVKNNADDAMAGASCHNEKSKQVLDHRGGPYVNKRYTAKGDKWEQKNC